VFIIRLPSTQIGKFPVTREKRRLAREEASWPGMTVLALNRIGKFGWM